MERAVADWCEIDGRRVHRASYDAGAAAGELRKRRADLIDKFIGAVETAIEDENDACVTVCRSRANELSASAVNLRGRAEMLGDGPSRSADECEVAARELEHAAMKIRQRRNFPRSPPSSGQRAVSDDGDTNREEQATPAHTAPSAGSGLQEPSGQSQSPEGGPPAPGALSNE